MRHLKLKNKLGVNSSHRKSLLRNLVTSLFKSGKIKTTLARAKAIRKDVDHIITLMKRGDLHARRQMHSFLYSKSLVYDLVNNESKFYKTRSGGFTRIIKAPNRAGDNAKMAFIELIKDEHTEIENQGSETDLLKEVKEGVSQNSDADSAESSAYVESNSSKTDLNAGDKQVLSSDVIAASDAKEEDPKDPVAQKDQNS